MMTWLAGSLAATSMAFTGCGSDATLATPNDPVTTPDIGTEIRSDKVRDTTPTVADAAIAELATGNSAFALDLYTELQAAEGNLFYSPYSVSLALAMTYAGATNDTLTTMADVLHFTLAEPELHPAFNALDLDLLSRSHAADGGEGAGLTLTLANALWSDGEGFLMPFLDTLAENYGAGMHLVDFAQPEAAAASINAWVEEQTESKIKDLLKPENLIDARLVLTDAIYFKAQWAKPFPRELTVDHDFALLDGSHIAVPTMVQADMFAYAAGDGYQAVQLDYDGEETSMLVVLPDAGRFAEIEGGFDPAFIAAIVDALVDTDVSVMLPRWSFESTFSLADTLKALGMGEAFSAAADFSRMDGTGTLYISDVLHKAFVAVNEDGTEAAAATAVVMVNGIPEANVHADRPFLFVIRDNITGTILFVGRVLNPAA